MTTLARNLTATDRILVVDAHDARLVIGAQVRIDDELLVFGEHAELPQDEAEDEPEAWYVRRGVDGTADVIVQYVIVDVA